MRFHRFVRSSFAPLLVLALASGCQSLYSHRPVPVKVLDAETNQPIAAADVKFSHPLAPEGFDASAGETGADGITRMWATPDGKNFLLVEAAAAGYLSNSMAVSDEALQQIKTAGWFESPNQRPAKVEMRLYKGPAFTVEFTVPAGYRGLVRADVQIHDDMPCPLGQRCFRYNVESGMVQVIGPAVIRHPQYAARYSDGTELGLPGAGQVGFRWLKREDKYECFVVGTQEEYDRFRRDLFPDDVQRAPAAKSQGGGKGGKGGGRGPSGGGNFGGPNGFSQ